MKKILVLLIVSALFAGFIIPCASADTEVKVTINGKNIFFDQPPVIIDGRTLVPLRAIFENLGAEVYWNCGTRTVSAYKGDTSVELAINDTNLYINGEAAVLDVPAQIVGNRTLVPIRAVSEAFDCEVGWDGYTKTVIITYDSTADFKDEVLRLVNEERAKAGEKPLSANSMLEKTAQEHSEDMAGNSFFSHTNLRGESPFDRMERNGIDFMSAGENIASGQRTPEEVMNSWMNSEGHRKNILNSAYTELGVGIAEDANGTLYWTQVFRG